MIKTTLLAASLAIASIGASVSAPASAQTSIYVQVAPPAPRAGSRQVVLFADTFNNHFEPDILRDAKRVLAVAALDK